MHTKHLITQGVPRMANGVLWLLAIVCATGAWAQQTNPLADEQALRKAVTIQNKMILLPELLREVGKQTGVSLTCAREMANDKLTVFVKEKLAVELLGHVATIVAGEWRKTRDDYAKLATSITPLHERRLSEQGGYALRFDIEPLVQHYPHLQFWATLTPVQKMNALRQGVLTIDALSAPQQRTFWQAAWQGMLSSIYPPFEAPEEPEGMPIPRLEVSFTRSEQYELISSNARYSMNDLNRLREFARQQFAEGNLDADYQIRGFRAETLGLRYFLYPGVRYSVHIALKAEIPVPKE